MPKVGIVCGGGIVSGKEIMTLQLATGLREIGVDVMVVNSHWSDGRFAKRLEEAGIPRHPVWFGFISAQLNPRYVYMTGMQIARWPQLLLGYRRFLREFDPEQVVHTNWHSLLMIYPFLRKERDLYWVHEVMPDKPQYRRIFHSFSKRLRSFVAVSNAVAESLRKIGIPADKVQTIHNGLPVPDISEIGKKPHNEVRIGVVGQVGAWKGHEDLMEAFRLVREAYPDAQLHIFGHGSADYEEFLRHRATELGVDRGVVWRGFVDDRSIIYRDLSLLAVPSRSEDPLPTTAIEAALFQIPVVASRRGGLVEIVEHDVTGCLFEAGKPKELAGQLIALLGNTELRRKMGQNARNRAISLFSRDRFVREFNDLLKTQT